MAVKKEPAAPAPVVSDKKKALETAMQQIEKMYGKGSIMRYGAESTLNVAHSGRSPEAGRRGGLRGRGARSGPHLCQGAGR